MNKKQFEILSAKSLTGEITEPEKETFNKLLVNSEELRKEFEEIKRIYLLDKTVEPSEVPDAETEWLMLERRIESLENSAQKSSATERMSTFVQNFVSNKWKTGLSFGFAAMALIIAVLFFQTEETNPVWITATAQNKEIREIMLPDGSSVKLNSGSEINYLKNFEGDVREIKLRGEAFFSVAKNGSPFVVITENSRTTVLGTKFDVRFRKGITKVIVKEGTVKLEPKDRGGEVILTKNLSASILKNHELTQIESVDADYLTGWLNGTLAFRATQLVDIAGELERRYDVPVKITNDSLNSLTLTGAFKNQNLDSTLSMICLALGLEYSKNENGYLLKPKNNSDTELY